MIYPEYYLDSFDFSLVANIASIASFIISFITLILAGGIRSSLRRHVEKRKFREQISATINNLDSFRSMIYKDSDVINTKFYYTVRIFLKEILDDYPKAISWGCRRKIKSLYRAIKKYLRKSEKDSQFRFDCAEKLHGISVALEKESEII